MSITEWRLAASGAWNKAWYWTDGVPDSGSNVLIDAQGSTEYTISLGEIVVDIHSLKIDSANANVNSDAKGGFHVSGLTMVSSGTLTTGAEAAFDGGLNINGGTVIVDDLTGFSASHININHFGTLELNDTNPLGATLNLSGNCTIAVSGYDPITGYNEPELTGDINFAAGTKLSVVSKDYGILFLNGHINAEGRGAVTIEDGGTLGGGSASFANFLNQGAIDMGYNSYVHLTGHLGAIHTSFVGQNYARILLDNGSTAPNGHIATFNSDISNILSITVKNSDPIQLGAKIQNLEQLLTYTATGISSHNVGIDEIYIYQSSTLFVSKGHFALDSEIVFLDSTFAVGNAEVSLTGNFGIYGKGGAAKFSSLVSAGIATEQAAMGSVVFDAASFHSDHRYPLRIVDCKLSSDIVNEDSFRALLSGASQIVISKHGVLDLTNQGDQTVTKFHSFGTIVNKGAHEHLTVTDGDLLGILRGDFDLTVTTVSFAGATLNLAAGDTIHIAANGILNLGATLFKAAVPGIDMGLAHGNTLIVDHDFSGIVSSLVSGDKFEIADVQAGTVDAFSFVENGAHTGGVLSLQIDGQPPIALHLSGDFTQHDFALGSAGGHEVITYSPVSHAVALDHAAQGDYLG